MNQSEGILKARMFDNILQENMWKIIVELDPKLLSKK